MGKTQSTQKTIDSSGEVNNNVVINEPDAQSSQLFQLVVISWTICVIKIIEFLLFVYNRHQKQLKKKYNNKANNPS